MQFVNDNLTSNLRTKIFLRGKRFVKIRPEEITLVSPRDHITDAPVTEDTICLGRKKAIWFKHLRSKIDYQGVDIRPKGTKLRYRMRPPGNTI